MYRKIDYYSARLNKENLEDFPLILGEKFYGSVEYIGSFMMPEDNNIYMITIENGKAVVRKCFQSVSVSQSPSPNNESGVDLTTTIYAKKSIESIPSEKLNSYVQNKVNLNLDSSFNCVQLIDDESFEFLYSIYKMHPNMNVYDSLLIYSYETKIKGRVYENVI